jgi:serine protease Do
MMNMEVRAMDNNEYGFNNMNGENNNAVENADVSSENAAQSAVETRTASGEQVYGSTYSEAQTGESAHETYQTDYSRNQYSNQSAYSAMYGMNNENVNNNDGNDRKEKKTKAKKEKKPHGFFFRAVRGVACAVVIGAVAGGSCYGAIYAGYVNFPAKSNNELTDEQLSRIAKEINKNYLASLSDGTSASGSTLASVSSDAVQTGMNVIDVSGIVKNVISSVVAISGTQTVTNSSYNFGFWGGFNNQSYEAGVSGSGIIIGANDTELLIVTNAHVVENVNNLKVTFGDNTEVDAVVKGMKTDSDLAVVAVKLDDISADTMSAISIAKLGSSSDVEVGEAAIAIGNAAGYGISVTTGIVSAVGKSLTVDNVVYDNLIQTDAAINPGNSGGALFNANGEVIGINSVKMSDTKVEGMGYAIAIESVKDIIDDLSTQTTRVALDNDERGYIGVSGSSVTSEISQTYGWPVGVLIRSVTEDSAAERAGLQVNDVITSFDGKDVDSWETLVNLMKYYQVGEQVEVVYSRLENGSFTEYTTTLTLTEKPQVSNK